MPAIVLDQWIELGARGCNSITARVKRQAEEAQSDMPFNSAVYEPGRDQIFAVRGGYVFRCNATTGAIMECSRFLAPAYDDTYITYDSVTDRLWATHWRSFDAETGTDMKKYLVRIHPDTLVATLINWDTGITFGGSFDQADAGPRQIVATGGFAFVLAYHNHEISELFRINLSTLTLTHQFLSVPDGGWGNILLDGSVIWYTSNDGFNSIDARTQAALAGHSESVQLNGISGPGGDEPCGIARNPGGAIYAVQGEKNPGVILKGTPSAAPALRTTIDLVRPNATPLNIRYNSADGLIYIPLLRDDTVAVLNPADDSFVIKTGFDSPFDVVFTTTKKFAVQHGPIGLLEIV